MAMTIHCDIVSAEQEIFSGLVEMLVATGELGELGVSYGHAPLLTSLVPGPVRVVTDKGDEQVYSVEIPAQLYQWAEAYVLTHYVAIKKTKRKLKRWHDDGKKPAESGDKA